MKNREFVLALSHQVSLELSNSRHDALGRFARSVGKSVGNKITIITKKLVKKVPTKKHIENAAKALGEGANDYALMNYGANTHTLAAAVSSLKHHVHKIRKIKPTHIKEFSKLVVSKLHGSKK